MLISERELVFLLYELLDTEKLLERPRYAEHSRDVFDATLETARRLAIDFFAPHNATGDQHEPVFKDGAALVLPETGRAWRAFADAGFLRAHWDAEEGGLQLPEVIFRAALAQFLCANVASTGYPFLTIGAANLLRTFGSPEDRRRYLAAMGDGRCSGTMALTEPGQGSSLADIKTTARPQPDGSYRLRGQKIFISGGDQDFTENIVHMVLARIEGAPPGAKGISLILVPKWLVRDGGSHQRNDVALAGLLHKMGWHNTTSTILSFGERGGATGYLVGTANQGLAHMFQMMNESRIGVGLMASCLAYRGFGESLAYARDRRQGRRPSSKDPLSPQVALVEHADVRRLLLAQKAYAEGSLALCLFASALVEDERTHPDPAQRDRARVLLELLTPVVKSWPSKYGCASNDMAIQVLGGAGYTRDYPVEQLYRDQRLNPIHEGAEAIHGLDLLGRKVAIEDGKAFDVFCSAVAEDIRRSQSLAGLEELALALQAALQNLQSVTAMLVQVLRSDPDLALANATLYLDTFGRVTVAWMWLKQADVSVRALTSSADESRAAYYRGKLQAAGYFFRWELPLTQPAFSLLRALDRTTLDMAPEWFQ
jgi:butyryl-CoA dehydrogenase